MCPPRDASLLVALALGAVRIGNESLWYDEAVSADYAGRQLRELSGPWQFGEVSVELFDRAR